MIFKFLLLAACAFNAQANPVASIPAPNIQTPNIEAKSFVLRDFNSNAILVENRSREQIEPASLTKVMTAYLAFEAVQQKKLSLTQALPISERAWKTEGSKMFVEPSIPVTVDELLHGLIIQSGNDAAIALAEGIAGSEENFAILMNQKALALGMTQTHFMNPTGLPNPEHYTTAYDLSILADALITHFPADYKRLYSQKEFTYNKITQPNRNRLLWLDPYVDGMKTGHTDSAGYCLIASSKRGESRLISVVVGTTSDTARTIESQKLLNYGTQFFDTHLVYKANQIISQQKIWKGDQDTLKLTVKQPVYFTMPKGQFSQVKASMRLAQPLLAPVKTNQTVGEITFTLNGQVIRTVPLVAAHDVGRGNVFSRMLDQIRMLAN